MQKIPLQFCQNARNKIYISKPAEISVSTTTNIYHTNPSEVMVRGVDRIKHDAFSRSDTINLVIDIYHKLKPKTLSVIQTLIIFA